jgi:hypothetical protein
MAWGRGAVTGGAVIGGAVIGGAVIGGAVIGRGAGSSVSAMNAGRAVATMAMATAVGAVLGQACQRGNYIDSVWADFGWPWVLTAAAVGWCTAVVVRDRPLTIAMLGACNGAISLVVATAAYYDFALIGRYRLFWLAAAIACGVACGAAGTVLTDTRLGLRLAIVTLLAAVTLGEAIYRLRHPPPYYATGPAETRYDVALMVAVVAAAVSPMVAGWRRRGAGAVAAVAALSAALVAVRMAELAGLPEYPIL